MHVINQIDWNMVAVGVTIIGSTYVFILSLRQDINSDVIRIDEKHEEHRKIIDERWISLLREIHSLDKKIEKTKSFKKASSG